MRGYGDPTCVESLSGYMETHQNIQEGGGSTIPKTGEREGGGGGSTIPRSSKYTLLNNYTFHNISCNL